MVHNRPGKRRRSICRYPEYIFKEYLWPSVDNLLHNNDYYLSRALVELVLNDPSPEARLLRIYTHAKRVRLDILADLTFDFLKTSPKYHDDIVCLDFMNDNLIPYYEVDNTKTGTYEM